MVYSYNIVLALASLTWTLQQGTYCHAACAQDGDDCEKQDVVEHISLLQQHSSYLNGRVSSANDKRIIHVTHQNATDQNAKDDPGKLCDARLAVYLGLPRVATTSFIHWASRFSYVGWHWYVGGSPRIHGGPNAEKDPYFNTTFWHVRPHRLAVSDSPWWKLSCQIYDSQPKKGMAKFILMKRDPVDWQKSLMSMFCHYSRGFCHVYRGVPVYGDSYNHFFDHLMTSWCNDDPDRICKDWRNLGVTSPTFIRDRSKLDYFQELHSYRVRQCVPGPDLLELNLEEALVEERMAKFLGCRVDGFKNKMAPKLPHDNTLHQFHNDTASKNADNNNTAGEEDGDSFLKSLLTGSLYETSQN